VFIGSTGGIIRYHYVQKKYDYPLTVSNGLIDNDVRAVALDNRSGYLYAATKLGLHMWDPYSQMMTSARYGELGFSMDEIILSIGFDFSSKIWFQTNKSYYSSIGSIRSLTHDDPVNQDIAWQGQLYQQQNQLPNLFISNADGFQYDPVQKTFVDKDFNRYPISCYAYDATGLLWVGTRGFGIWSAETISNFMKPLTYGLYMKNVTAMTFDQESMWLGGSHSKINSQFSTQETSGITEWNQLDDKFYHHESTYRKGIQFNDVNCILTDSSFVWIGTGKGLIQKSKKSDYWTTYGAYSGLYHPTVYSLTRHQKKLFIGTKQGLNYAVEGKNNYDIYKVEIPELFNLTFYKMLSEQSVLWLGTNNGIYAIDESNQKWLHYNAYGFKVGATTYTRDEIRGIAENDSNIFFISNSNVVRYHKTNREWLSITVNTDFLNAGVNDAQADQNNLWIATNSGVLRLHLKKQKWFFYSKQDGLCDDYVYAVLLDGDYVWFGTHDGLTQFFWNAPHLKE
jgi:ligand-binding sensor domain-containing protein